jgi:hypothetical protein
MDVLLSPEAYSQLRALQMTATPSGGDGILLGHRRGPARFVEKILPTSKGFFPSIKAYQSLQDFFQDKIIGFFTLNPDKNKTKKILAPSTCGQVYVEVRQDGSKRMKLKAYLVDYNMDFSLKPLRIKNPQTKV